MFESYGVELNGIFKKQAVEGFQYETGNLAPVHQAQKPWNPGWARTQKAVEQDGEKVYYPLTHAQKRIYYDNKFHPGTAVSTAAFIVRYQKILDQKLLKQAINLVIKRNEGFRLRIVESDSETGPRQYVSEFRKISPDYIDFSGPDCDNRLRDWAKTTTAKPIELIDSDLFYFAIIKYNQSESGYYVKIHHLIVDGWSYSLIFSQINQIYEDLEAGKSPNDCLNPSYVQYIEQEKEYLNSRQFIKDKEFWHNHMLPLPEPVKLTDRKTNPGDGDIRGETYVGVIPKPLLGLMEEYCQKKRVSFFKLVLMAMSIYAARISGLNEVTVGAASHNRAEGNRKNIIGMFVSTLPIRVKIDYSLTFDQLLEKTTKTTTHILKNHQGYPYDLLASELKESAGTDTGYLLDIFITSHSDPGNQAYTFEHIFQGHAPCVLNLHIDLNNKYRDGILELGYEYRLSHYSKKNIIRIHQGVMKILNDALSKPGLNVGELEIVPGKEKNKILYEYNRTNARYPDTHLLHELFEARVEKTPDYTAVVYRESCLTYRAINERANRLAWLLRREKVYPDQIVGLMIEPSLEMMIGMLAILKAGGAYLPIDPGYPKDRIGYLLEDTGSQLLLTREKYAASLEFNGKVIDLQEESCYSGEKGNLKPVNKPGDLAYIIYTSGSTGKPKGVAVQHRSVVNLAYSQKKAFGINEQDRVLQFSSISFDASVEQIYIALLSSATLVLVDKNVILDVNHIGDFISRQSLTHIHAVPLFVGRIPVKNYKSLKRVISGGDVCPLELINNWVEYCDFCNEYGPTETTVTSIQDLVRKGEKQEEMSIGKALNNTYLYVLGPNMGLQPIGVPGELYIGGDGVARGYLNRIELTAEVFKPNPFIANQRIYKTGDLVKWRPDGNIDFMGRIDHQVKIRGYRIELGEIENRLSNHPGVKQAMVMAREDKPGEKYLCAYLLADETLEMTAIRKSLSKTLPAYMVPSYFVQIDRIPKTPSGKVDKKALPAPNGESTEEYAAPTNEFEEKLAGIWEELLGIEKVGINDDFFEVGGHSLKLFQAADKISKVFGIKLAVSQLQKHTRMKDMATLIAIGRYEEEAFLRFNSQTAAPGNIIFCFPPIYGYGFIYKELAAYLPGYQFVSFNFIEEKDKIKKYADIITEMQPEGPYLLFGWSAGGQLCFHVARELEKRGRKTAEIVLFDTHLKSEYPNEEYMAMLEDELDDADEFVQGRKKFIKQIGLDWHEDKIIAKIKSYMRYLISLDLPGVNSNVQLITAEDREGHLSVPHWKRLTGKTFKTYSGNGKHVEMLFTGHLEKNAGIFREIVEKVH